MHTNSSYSNSILICITFLSLFRMAAAQPGTNPDSALQVILSQIEGTRLTLDEAIDSGLRYAASVRTAEAVLMEARGAVRKDRGFYDPELFFNLQYFSDEVPTASFFAGSPTLITGQTTSSGGLRMNLPIGTELELAVNSLRLTTNSQFAFLNPEYSGIALFSIRQPLLRGFSTSGRKQLNSSESQLEAAQARYDQQVFTTSAEVERMYWDLYAAERDYAVQKLTRNRAEAFVREAELRREAGLAGPSQVANARTFLAEQELILLQTAEQLDRLSDQLSSLIGLRPGDGLARFIPTDIPPGNFSVEPVESLVENAQQNNLLLRAAQKDVEAVDALARAAKWEALPSVDLVGQVGGNGLAGTTRDVIFGGDTLSIPPGRSGGFGDVMQQITNHDFPNWSVGVEISIPIGLRSGLGERDRLNAQVVSQQQRYIDLSRQLEAQIRDVYRILANGKARLTAAREGVEAAQEQVRIGLIEFRDGQVTAFELVRLGEDFAIAQRRYSQALVLTAKAAATLKQLTSDTNAARRLN